MEAYIASQYRHPPLGVFSASYIFFKTSAFLVLKFCLFIFIILPTMTLQFFWPVQALIILSALLGFLLSGSGVSAQSLPCGNIVGLQNTVSITDCENPFGVEEGGPFDFIIEGVTVNDNDTVFVEGGSTSDYLVTNASFVAGFRDKVYLHVGNNYREVDVEYLDITRADYNRYAIEFFGELNASAELYIDLLMNEDVDTSSPDWDYQEYNAFENYVEDNYVQSRPVLESGTYTLVVEEMIIWVSQTDKTWLDVVREVFIKTAHAQYTDYPVGPKYALTFTIAEAMPEPTGASSVLFLPGIMGSRLFEDSADCAPYGSEVSFKQIRWPSGDDCDIARMDMSSLGISVNDIFTEKEGGVIEDIGVVVNLYESLLEDLAVWKSNDLIADYRAVPYDWRLSLYDILKAKEVDGRIVPDTFGMYQDGYVYRSLVDLAEESPAGKVVLVGHSNGGLVIQALLATMKANTDPLLEAIEKVILVAVPQLGTPESVVGLLHGVQLDPLSFIISHEESRKLMNTSPFAYHLLPSGEYYDTVTTPVITFEPGTSTDSWIAQFGNELNTLEKVTAFLAKESGRVTPEWNNTATPATLYSHLLGYGESVHTYLDDWKPAETKVYEVAGIGLSTPTNITYFTDTKCTRREQTHFANKCVEFESKLSYRVTEVIDGDGTVVVPSAFATTQGSGVEKFWVDLKAYGKFRIDKKHKDILEVEEVRDFVSGVISSSALGSYIYLSTSEPNFPDENRLLLRLHSPLDMFVVLHDGEVVGSSTPSLRGVEYRRYGEVQQLSIPEDEVDYEIQLIGLAEGSFTLEIEQYEGDELGERVTYSALPTSTTTKVTIALEDEELLSEVNLLIDYNGDGIFETTALPGLSQVTFETPEIIATSTPVVIKQSGTSGTRVKDRMPADATFATASVGLLTASAIETGKSGQELLLQLVALLTQYRDLLIKLRLQ
jgi:pimeloyl-ACP methyl ester carboxylesterase